MSFEPLLTAEETRRAEEAHRGSLEELMERAGTAVADVVAGHVAADADPNTGYNVTVHGSNTVVGGTSAVAPLYAGLFAAFGKKLGFVTPSLYKNPAAFTDITTGSNGYYSAAAGPDPCTGLGAPIGNKLAPLFTAASGHNPNDQIKG